MWEAAGGPHRLSLISQLTLAGFPQEVTSVAPLGSHLEAIILWEAISLKGLVCDQNLLSGRKNVPPPTQMPGRGWCQMVTGPSFSATVIALCKGGKMPGQLLPSVAEPQAFGEFQTETSGRKRTSPRDPPSALPRPSSGRACGEIMERDCSFLFHRCNSNAGDIRAETLQRGQQLKLSVL